jgi:hypothetical protein
MINIICHYEDSELTSKNNINSNYLNMFRKFFSAISCKYFDNFVLSMRTLVLSTKAKTFSCLIQPMPSLEGQ